MGWPKVSQAAGFVKLGLEGKARVFGSYLAQMRLQLRDRRKGVEVHPMFHEKLLQMLIKGQALVLKPSEISSRYVRQQGRESKRNQSLLGFGQAVEA